MCTGEDEGAGDEGVGEAAAIALPWRCRLRILITTMIYNDKGVSEGCSVYIQLTYFLGSPVAPL